MPLVWIGVSLTGLAWLYLTPLTARADYPSGSFLMTLGFLFLIVGATAQQRPTRVKELFRSLETALGIFVAELGLGLCLAPLWRLFFARVHRLPLVVHPLATLVRALGLPASGDGQVALVAVANERLLLNFAGNAEILALPIAAAILTAGALLLLLGRFPARSFVKLAVAGVLFVVVRFVVLVFAYANLLDPTADHQAAASFFGLDEVAVSFLPLALVLAFVFRRLPANSSLLALRLFATPQARTALPLFTGGFALATALLFVDPGRSKAGRILIDDVHSGDWEPTTETLDTVTYGSMSVYNLTSFKDFLRFHYPKVEVLRQGELTETLLDGYDVLLLKTPTQPVRPREIEALEGFVRRGGGLWLVGDHTNLLGMGTYTNAVAERFGMRFRYDACNALSTNYFGEWYRPAIVRHPVMQRVPWFRLLTSASLEVGWSSDLVMVVPDLLSDPVDYSKPSFFGDISPDPGDDFGALPVAAASRYGRGRVLAFSDSTILSSFAIFKEGHVEFAMAVIDYLNHENLLGRWPNRLLAFLGCGLLGLGLRRLSRDEPSRWVTTLTLALVGGAFAGALAMRQLNLETFKRPVPRSRYRSVGFPVAGNSFHLAPAISRILVPPGNEYSTFFVGLQRLGLVPRQAPRYDGIDDDAAVVLVNPSTAPPEGVLSQLRSYVDGGGRVLILLPDRPPNRATELLLQSFGLRYQPGQIQPSAGPRSARFGDGLLVATTTPRRAQIAGADLLPTDPELPVEVYRSDCGAGRVVVILGSTYFSRAGMGHVMQEPDEDQMKRYRLEYLVMYDLLGIGTIQPVDQTGVVAVAGGKNKEVAL